MKQNKIVKRFSCLMMALILSFTMMMPQVKAVELTKIVFEDVKCEANDEIIIPVTIENNPGIATFRFRMSYDTSVMSFVSAQKGSALTKGTFTSKVNVEEEHVTFLWYSVEDVTNNGAIAYLKFKVSEDAKGNYPLSVTYLEEDLLNTAHESIMFTLEESELQVINKIALGQLIQEANELNLNDYTSDSVEVLESALVSAQTVYDDENASQKQIDDACTQLSNALDALVTKVVVDKTELQEVYDANKNKVESKYTTESWAPFKIALDEAKALLDDNKATQQAVNEATTNLMLKASALKEVVVVNKDALKEVIDEAKAIDQSKYTSSSLTAFTSALTVAEYVYNQSSATQAQVDEAKENLQSAISALVLKPVEPTKPAMNFIDVKKGAWFYGSVEKAYNKDLMGATGKGKEYFEPDAPITRAMVATVLYRMADKPKVSFKAKFKDVTNGSLWYAVAITWASENRVVSGYKDGSFGPDDNITRQDLAIMLRNYAKSKGLDTNVTIDFSSFKDGKQVATYAETAVQFCIDAKLMSGSKKSDGTYLMPTANASRAECAKMFSLLDDAIDAAK